MPVPVARGKDEMGSDLQARSFRTSAFRKKKDQQDPQPEHRFAVTSTLKASFGSLVSFRTFLP